MAPGVPGRLRAQIFFTFQHYKGGRSSAKSTGRLYPGRNPWYSLSEAESTSGHCWGYHGKKSPVTPPGIDPGTVHLVAQRLVHYATPGPLFCPLLIQTGQLFRDTVPTHFQLTVLCLEEELLSRRN